MAYTLVPTELIVDGAITSAKLDTNIAISGTLGVTGEVTLATHLIMGDNDKIKIGTGGDLEIYHDGSNSYISNSTGNIYLGDTNGAVHIQAKLNEESIICAADGAVTLYHDNSPKLATSSAGVTVTGTLAATLSTAAQPNITSLGTLTGLTVNGATTLTHSGTTLSVDRTGGATALIELKQAGTIRGYLGADSTKSLIVFNNSAAEKFSVSNTGIDVTGTATMDGLTVNSSEVLFDNTGGDFTLKLNTNAVSDKNEIIMGDSGTPLAKFGVGGTANDIITGSDGQDFNIGTAGGGRAINFSTDNFASVEMKLDGGKLGIGTNPYHTFDVFGAVIANGAAKSNGLFFDTTSATTGTGGGIALGGYSNGTGGAVYHFGNIQGIKENSTAGNYASAMLFSTRANGATPTERMRIDSSGAVGIGQVPETARFSGHDILQVGGRATLLGNDTVTATGQTVLLDNLYYDASGNFQHRGDARGVAMQFVEGKVIFSNSNQTTGTPTVTPRMTLDNSGNLLVGTTSAASGFKLQVDGGAGNARYTNIDTGGSTFDQFRFNDGLVGSITTNGVTTAFNTSSDARLKENVDYDFTALDRVAQLKPARFNFIADADTTVDGFLAHEVQDIVPEAVTGEKDAVKEEEYEITPAVLDDDGNVVTEAEMGTREVPEYQGIDQSKLVPLLTKAIQEQQTIIDDLKSRIETLEG